MLFKNIFRVWDHSDEGKAVAVIYLVVFLASLLIMSLWGIPHMVNSAYTILGLFALVMPIAWGAIMYVAYKIAFVTNPTWNLPGPN